MSKAARKLDRLNILIVDDREENLLALEAILEEQNHRLVRAKSGEEALRAVLKEDIALILMDVRMPSMDGLETARLIRQREKTSRTPIIFLTAVASGDEQIFEGYASGAVDYISKPFVPEILKAKVKVFAELFQKTKELQRINETLEDLVEERTNKLKQAEEKYRSIFETALEGIFQTSKEGRYITANPAMANMLGYESPEQLIESIDDVQKDVYTSSQQFAEYTAELSEQGSVTRFESTVKRRDGSIIWISENTHVIKNELGEVIGYEGMAEEITRRKQAETQTTQRNRDLESLLHVISHDLREPLRSIMGYSEIVVEDHGKTMSEEAKGLLQRVVRAAGRLSTLLDNVQTLIHAQRIGPATDKTDMNEVVREALSLLEKKIEDSGARIQVNNDLPNLRADKSWACQAVYNLIANAIKFTCDGKPPEIEVDLYHDDNLTRRELGIVVRDRGPGVAPEHADHVFELFRREVGREIEGTGAGLAIVRQVAERHNGRAWVQPREGGGSEFILTFGE